MHALNSRHVLWFWKSQNESNQAMSKPWYRFFENSESSLQIPLRDFSPVVVQPWPGVDTCSIARWSKLFSVEAMFLEVISICSGAKAMFKLQKALFHARRLCKWPGLSPSLWHLKLSQPRCLAKELQKGRNFETQSLFRNADFLCKCECFRLEREHSSSQCGQSEFLQTSHLPLFPLLHEMETSFDRDLQPLSLTANEALPQLLRSLREASPQPLWVAPAAILFTIFRPSKHRQSIFIKFFFKNQKTSASFKILWCSSKVLNRRKIRKSVQKGLLKVVPGKDQRQESSEWHLTKHLT